MSLGQFVDHEHVVTLVIDEPRAIFLARISIYGESTTGRKG